jgi:hypothetical protein
MFGHLYALVCFQLMLELHQHKPPGLACPGRYYSRSERAFTLSFSILGYEMLRKFTFSASLFFLSPSEEPSFGLDSLRLRWFSRMAGVIEGNLRCINSCC